MASTWLSVVVVVVVLQVLITTALHPFSFKHHNNAEILKVLEGVHQDCPNITRIYTLSETSVKGTPLYVIEFSTHPGQHEQRK